MRNRRWRDVDGHKSHISALRGQEIHRQRLQQCNLVARFVTNEDTSTLTRELRLRRPLQSMFSPVGGRRGSIGDEMWGPQNRAGWGPLVTPPRRASGEPHARKLMEGRFTVSHSEGERLSRLSGCSPWGWGSRSAAGGPGGVETTGRVGTGRCEWSVDHLGESLSRESEYRRSRDVMERGRSYLFFLFSRRACSLSRRDHSSTHWRALD